TRTRLGVQMRAAAEDFGMARLLGVKVNKVIASAFAISGAVAAVAAFVLVSQTGTVSPTMGLQPVLVGFVAMVLGGMGSLRGAARFRARLRDGAASELPAARAPLLP